MDDGNIKILSVGAATQDVFIMGKALTARRDVRTKDYVEQFPLGAKISVDDVRIETGGGGTNAAVTFARQGLSSEFVGKIGHDAAGTEVLRILKREGVATEHVAYDSKLGTGYSTILLAPNGERTILNYRGASHELSAKDYNLSTLDADWFYITSLAGNFDLLSKLLKHAKNHGIKVLLNPGEMELAKGKKLRKLLPFLEVLYGNTQELQELFGGDSPKETMIRSFGICPYVVMTDGQGGAYVSDGDKLYYVGLYQKVKVVDRTGAGDAFGAGLVSALAKGLNLSDALTLASANATSVVTKIGGKPGILRTTRLRPLKLQVLSI
jgi:sugar/nucleoside kinase (ribokinase family)